MNIVALRLMERIITAQFLQEAAVTTTTIAFTLKRYGRSDIFLSEGRVEVGSRQVSVDEGWEDDEDEIAQPPARGSYAAPGTRIITQAVEFQITPVAPWAPGPILSFVWALRKALPIWLTCSDSDFEVTWMIHPDHLRVLIADTVAGSNGISQNLWDALSGAPHELEAIIRDDVLRCSCHGVCERCLLLPRTPEPYLRKGLITRQHLREFLGGATDAG